MDRKSDRAGVTRAVSVSLSSHLSAPSDPPMPAASGESRPGVVAVLPRGEAIRNFVYSGALDAVARQTDLAVLSVKPSEAIWDTRLPELKMRTFSGYYAQLMVSATKSLDISAGLVRH